MKITRVGQEAWIWIPLIVLCAVPAGFAEQANMTLTGVGSHGTLAGVYIGPYVANINGVPTQVICNDFVDDSYVNESWTVNIRSLSDLSDTKWGGLPDAALKYNQAAWLSLQLLDSTISNATAADIQFALWQVFVPTSFDWLDNYGLGTDRANAQAWLNQATKHQNDQFTNIAIYAYSGGETGCPGGCTGRPQEFIVRTPEPHMAMLLGVDLSALGLLAFVIRRRQIRSRREHTVSSCG